MEPVIVFIALFATVFGVTYVFFTTRNKERLAMIEKGADAKLFDRSGSKFSIAKFILNLALLFIGIGLGIFTGSILGTDTRFNGEVVSQGFTTLDMEITIPSMIFIFGGLGLIAGFFITRKIEKGDHQ
ncbi:MAG: DUF6249 domain-containing protein [Cyclobacteriaceae bacterium]